MRNLPVFTTENGVASLTLDQIPYRREAYIRIQSVSDVEKLLAECCDFCRMAGGERIYASGHPEAERYPLHTVIVKMQCQRQALMGCDACVFPVTEQTLPKWRDLYNQRMAGVPNASWMTEVKGQQLLREGAGYFVHREGKLLGIGSVSGGQLTALAAVEPGAGEQVVRALASVIPEETVTLEVAVENLRAVELYRRLGFLPVEELARWYQIF